MHINIILSISLLSTSAIGLVIPADDILESRSPKGPPGDKAGKAGKAGGKVPQGPPPLTPAQQNSGFERYMQMSNMPDPNNIYHIRGGPTAPALTYSGKDVHDSARRTALEMEKTKTQQVKNGLTDFKNYQHEIPLDGVGGKRTFDGLPYNPKNLAKEAKLPLPGSNGQPGPTGPARAIFRKSSLTGDIGFVGVTSHHQGKPPGLDTNDHFHVQGYEAAHRDPYQHHPGPHGYPDPLPAVDLRTGKQNYNRLPPLHTNGYDPSNPFGGPDMGKLPKRRDPLPLPQRKASSAETQFPRPLTPEGYNGGSSGKYQGGSTYQGGNQYEVSPSQLRKGGTRQDSTGQGGSSKGKERRK